MLIFCGIVDSQYQSSGKQKNININEQIFIKIANNDLAAFEEFYYATERSVYAYALSILRNHDDALDVVQETYLKIRGAAHLYKPMGKPMAWVFTITCNLCMSKLRMNRQAEDITSEELENDISFSYVADHDDKIILESALKILSEEERKIILLHAMSGFTHIEISRSIDMPLSTVLSKYHRGLKKLKKYLFESEVLK